jgi:uncharacterized membrane protein
MLLLEGVRSSYWFVPGLMLLMGGGLALLLVSLDHRVQGAPFRDLWWVFSGGASGARTVLSTVAGSIITVAGTTFSITIAVLTLTSSQFGPRLLRGFMRDTGNQVVLGTFLATFLYCLLVERTVRSVDEYAFVPHMAVTTGIALAMASVCVLIYFIHHVSLSIQATHIVASVARELDEALDRLFPGQIGEERVSGAHKSDESTVIAESFRHPIHARRSAYIQAIDGEVIFDTARTYDLVVNVLCAPGAFLRKGQILAMVRSASLGTVEGEITKSLTGAFILGDHRTGTKDVEFLFLQLVEVAARALSPGINDPFTAIMCLDRLGAALAILAGRELPSPVRRDDGGTARVIAPISSFSDILELSLVEIICYGGSDPMVVARIFALIDSVWDCTRTEKQRDALRHQATRIHAVATIAAAKDTERVSALDSQLRTTLNRFAPNEQAVGAASESTGNREETVQVPKRKEKRNE